MPPAARVSAKIMQDGPHCHAPIHPPAPTPTVMPHPALRNASGGTPDDADIAYFFLRWNSGC